MVFVLCFIFLFRWFFGLIRPGFCYVTFLKIPLLIEEISCILWFFWESFYRKDPSNGFLMERSIFIFCIFLQFWPVGGLFFFANFFNLLSRLSIASELLSRFRSIRFHFSFFFFYSKAKTVFYFNGLFFKLLLASSFIDYLFVSFKNHP